MEEEEVPESENIEQKDPSTNEEEVYYEGDKQFKNKKEEERQRK